MEFLILVLYSPSGFHEYCSPLILSHNVMLDIHSRSISQFPYGRVFSPLLSVTVAGILLVGCNATTSTSVDRDATTSSSASSSSESINTSQSSEAAMRIYKNGTFSADGVYRSPAGGESVHVTLVLKDDVVTDVTFSGDATHKKSIEMQAAFGGGIKEKVVGKSLDEVSVTVVNGSSLTSGGFMQAVTKIKAEAKA